MLHHADQFQVVHIGSVASEQHLCKLLQSICSQLRVGMRVPSQLSEGLTARSPGGIFSILVCETFKRKHSHNEKITPGHTL